MKWFGIFLCVPPIIFIPRVWSDRQEGPIIISVCGLIILLGIVFFFQGLKNELIREIDEARKDIIFQAEKSRRAMDKSTQNDSEQSPPSA